MIARLAPGVTVVDGHVVDDVRGRSYPLNDTGRHILQALPGTVAQVAAHLAAATGRPAATAHQQTAQFLALLNSRLLVNLPSNELRRLQVLLTVTLPMLLSGRLVPADRVVRRRMALDTSSRARILVGVVKGLSLPAARLGLVSAAAIAVVLAGLGVRDVLMPLTLGAAMSVGVLVHEAGHAVTLLGTPAALGVKGLRPFVLHPPHDDAHLVRLTAQAGPLAGLVLGALTLVPAYLFESGPLALLALITASQGVGLTVLASDGRRACLAS